MTYRSKKDWWLYGLVWGLVVGLLAAGLLSVLVGDPRLGRALSGAGPAALLGVLLTTHPLNCEITGAELVVEYLKGGETRALLVSPEDKPAFMRDLADAAPGLKLRGGRVVRIT